MPASSAPPAEHDAVSPEWLLARIDGHGAHQLRAGIEALIASGDLAGGARLPTIRELARSASLSVGTVLTVWNQLRDLQLIETRRRGGTVVRRHAGLPSVAIDGDWSSIDFQLGAPDLRLQPDLSAALLDSLTERNLNVFGREYMTQRLHAAVAPSWPFAAEAWTTAGGGTEALLLATAGAARPGQRIAVDQPLSPGFMDTLRDLRLEPIAVHGDAHGPAPAELAAAARAGAVAFVFQPGAPFADGYAVTPARVAELAAVLDTPDAAGMVVVEDDSIGPLAAHEPPTLGRTHADRVIRVRSYCKAFGIDVRTSVIGGAARLVDAAIAQRSHGVGSNSRILQNALAYLTHDPVALARVADARDRYARRRGLLMAALERRGVVAHHGADAIVVWAEVADETDALVALAARGVLAGAGSRSFVDRPEQDLIRISPLQLPDDDPGVFDRLAAVIAAAAGGRREFFD
jgi:DNA-binding transcriptional MocR family regulator